MKSFKEIRNYIVIERQKYTDKFESGFAEFYFNYFNDKRESLQALMEIGVNRGGSILFWKYFFINAQIYGIDIRPRIRNYDEDRVHMHVADQSDAAALVSYANKTGPLDIIVDDGSHKISHQITSFEALWPFVKKGGYYVIEDTQTSYMTKYLDMGDLNFVDYCKNKEIGKDGIASINYFPDVTIGKISTRSNMIIFRKES